MSLLGTLFNKILGRSEDTSSGGVVSGAQAAPTSGSGPTGGSASSGGSAAGGTAPAGGQVDVAQVLDGMAAKAGQPLNWKTSIVDLMKLVGMDSSLTARKELADELHYTGDKNDSATMNIWLHKQVMQKLAANGGKLPDDLKHG